MIVSSSGPTVASTTARVVPVGKTMTIVSGSVPCSILRLNEVDARGEGEGDAIGFVDACAIAAAAAAFSDSLCLLSMSTAPVRGMLTKRT
jgi:hypothetical protein